MPVASSIPLAVIGFGGVVRKVHRHALRVSGVFDVRAVIESDADARAAAAKAFPGAGLHDDLEGWLADGAAACRAVLIATPPHTHATLTAACHRAGLHTYTEKPGAVTEADADALRPLTQRSDHALVAAFGLNYRFRTDVADLRMPESDGDATHPQLGRLRLVQTLFAAPAGKRQAGWKTDDTAGGGVLWDLASHHLDLVCHLLGRSPIAIRADLDSVESPGDTATLDVRFDGGPAVQIASALGATEADRIVFVGDAGARVADRFRPIASGRLPRQRGFSPEARIRSTVRDARAAMIAGGRNLRPRREPSHAAALGAFADRIRSGGTPAAERERCPLADIADVLQLRRLLAAAQRSGGQWIDV